MNIFLSMDDLKNLPWESSSVAIGTFDGVHRGHQAVIKRAVEDANLNGRSSVVFTFDRHPSEVVRPSSSPPYLCSVKQRIRLIENLEVDNLILVPFTHEFSSFTAEAFAYSILKQELKCKHVFVGADFHFGRDRSGDVTFLKTEAEKFDFQMTSVKAETEHDQRISSTNIRSCVANGNIKEANFLLGYNYTFVGTVISGQKLGRTLGFPTANLVPSAKQVIPGDGIYAVRASFRGITSSGACSIGMRPAVNGKTRTIEVYLFDTPVPEEFYGAVMEVEFVKRLRDELNFDNLEDLKAQIAKDVQIARNILNG